VHERFRNRHGHRFSIDGGLSVPSSELKGDPASPFATLEKLGVWHNDVRRSDSHLHLQVLWTTALGQDSASSLS
jgi:hypothetical protein